MNKRVVLGITSAVVMGGLAATSMADDRFTYHGYWRAGFIQSFKGGSMNDGGFQAPNSGARYRLGQENNIYGENILVKEFQAGDNGPTAKFETMLGYWGDIARSDEEADDSFKVREAFMEFTNFDFDKDAKVWVGKRYYGREDIHINDFFWLNSSGTGAGAYNLSMSDTVKFDVALIRSADDAATSFTEDGLISKLGLDLRLHLAMGGAGDLTLVAIPQYMTGGDITTTTDGVSSTKSYDDHSGVALTLIHNIPTSTGFNKAALQWGSGVAAIGTQYNTDTIDVDNANVDDVVRMRVLDLGVMAPADNFSFMYDVIYQHYDNGADSASESEWFSAGVRPLHNVTKYFGIAVEAGFDWTSADQADNKTLEGSVATLCICPQITLDSDFWARPVLRGFITMAKWSSDFEGMVGGSSYADATSGMDWGFQMETWF